MVSSSSPGAKCNERSTALQPVVALATKARSSGFGAAGTPPSAARTQVQLRLERLHHEADRLGLHAARATPAARPAPGRGVAPNEPWLRKVTPGSSPQCAACSDRITAIVDRCPTPPSPLPSAGSRHPGPGRHAGRHRRDADPRLARGLRRVRHPSPPRPGGAPDRGRWQAAGARRGGGRRPGASRRAATRRSIVARGEIYGRLNRAPKPLPGVVEFLGRLDARGIPGRSPPHRAGSRSAPPSTPWPGARADGGRRLAR